MIRYTKCFSQQNKCIWVVDSLDVSKYVLVDSQILPEVYHKVLLAKSYLASREAVSAAQAARMAGISRSAFYKYKDSVFTYHHAAEGEVITLSACLLDNPGVLSSLMNTLYQAGANILSVNQNIPVNNVATVSITVRVAELNMELAGMLEQVRAVEGVKTVDEIKG